MARSSIPNSQVLGDRMQVTCGSLQTTYRRLWQRTDLAVFLPSFLILMHQIVRASVPLMKVARLVAAKRGAHDPVSRKLAAYLSGHIKEERDHDEWLLEDLAVVGLSRDDILGRIPSSSVASLVGAQYYWIQHHHPVALLGYIRLLEGNAPSEAHIEDLQRRSGLPAALLRTYRLHGALDPTHMSELDASLDSLTLSESQGQLIWISASHSATVLASCLEDVERECLRSAQPGTVPRLSRSGPHSLPYRAGRPAIP